MSKKLLSIVLPAYREQKSIPLIYHSLTTELKKLSDYDYEIIFVNDGSPDNTRQEIEKLCHHNQNVKGLNLSKNFGKEIALTAGVNASQGDAIITLDVDGQHPVDQLHNFVSTWEQGYDVVYNQRPDNPGASWIKRQGSKWFYKIFNAIADLSIEPGTTDYRLIDRKVANIFEQYPEQNRMYRGIIDMIGFRRKALIFDALPNPEDRVPSYTFSKLVKLALDGLTSFSVWPLKVVGWLGFLITLISGVGAVFVVAHILLGNAWGFTNLGFFVLVNTFFIGIVMIALGFIAIYIANIHEEVLDRPLYTLQDTINF